MTSTRPFLKSTPVNCFDDTAAMASSRPSAPPDENAIQPADNVNSSTTTSKVAESEVQPTMSDVMEEKKHDDEDRWISGMQLWLLMMPLCFTFFLVLLDISIIATVSILGCLSRTTQY